MSLISKLITETGSEGKEVWTDAKNFFGEPVLDLASNNIKGSLDLVYRNSALLLNDIPTLADIPALQWGKDTQLSVPIIGFVYEHPSQLEMLKYQYSDYPFLNKTTITNSYTKQNTSITLRSYHALSSYLGVVELIALNEGVYYGIEYYCDRGGTFKLLTFWGAFTNLVLESLSIISPQGNQPGGLGFEWRFKKIPFDSTSEEAVFGEQISKLSNSLV